MPSSYPGLTQVDFVVSVFKIMQGYMRTKCHFIHT